MVSILSNSAASAAQGNIARANDAASSSIARLSSGNRIVKASDDVAGLSVGTILSTGVTTLKQALANAGQGTSLLQVADGALAQISDILTRQKAIATQANSGTLSDTDRSYLNQEFAALTAQIDQIAGATSFSSVKLLDGSLSGAVNVVTNKNTTATQTTTLANAANVTTAGAIATIVSSAAGDTLTINGVTVTFAAATAGVGTTSSVGKVIIGATVTATANNVVAFLNSSKDARLANLQFTNTAGAISAVYTGGAMDPAGSYTVSVSSSNTTNATVGSAANRLIAYSANNLNGLGYSKVQSLGSVTGSILVNGDTAAANSGQAISTLNVLNNAEFIGKLGQGAVGKITGTFTQGTANTANLQLQVGNITYTAAAVNMGTAGTYTFTGADSTGAAAGGSFTITTRTAQAFTSQQQLDPILTQLNNALSGITFTQNRDITSDSFTAGATIFSAGIQVGTLNGASVNLRSDDFSQVVVQSFDIVAPTNGGTDAIITAVINGETYQSVAGQGNQIAQNTTISLQNLSDPTKALSISTGNAVIPSSTTVSLDLSTQANADAIAQAFRTAFGFDGKSSAVNLQVGARSADTIGVQIANVNSTSLFKGAALDITTVVGARAASAAVDGALATISATRATVGALQSRFNFTSANLQASITNQDAARSVLLDADVSGESTAFSTAQVQLQAGIAVLAQANQLTQNLLKLIQ